MCMQQLDDAYTRQDEARLRQCLEVGGALGLLGLEMDNAAHLLWALEARPAAVLELRTASQAGDHIALAAALDAAMVVGAPAEDLKSASDALRDLERAARVPDVPG